MRVAFLWIRTGNWLKYDGIVVVSIRIEVRSCSEGEETTGKVMVVAMTLRKETLT
jgi:hypothetical protein